MGVQLFGLSRCEECAHLAALLGNSMRSHFSTAVSIASACSQLLPLPKRLSQVCVCDATLRSSRCAQCQFGSYCSFRDGVCKAIEACSRDGGFDPVSYRCSIDLVLLTAPSPPAMHMRGGHLTCDCGSVALRALPICRGLAWLLLFTPKLEVTKESRKSIRKPGVTRSRVRAADHSLYDLVDEVRTYRTT